MDKRIITLLFIVWTMSINLYAEGNAMISLVKQLEDIIVFGDSNAPDDLGVTVAAKEYVQYFKTSRKENILNLITFFHIDSIDAILEWGGGLRHEYYVIILSKDMIFFSCWIADNVSYTKIKLDNQVTIRTIKEKLDFISTCSGGAISSFSTDRKVFFITLYNNGHIKKAFYSDFPENNLFQIKDKKTYFNELESLIKLLVNSVKTNLPQLTY